MAQIFITLEVVAALVSRQLSDMAGSDVRLSVPKARHSVSTVVFEIAGPAVPTSDLVYAEVSENEGRQTIAFKPVGTSTESSKT